MKLVAAVFADFERTFLGAPSALEALLCDRPILQRTLERVRRVSEVAAHALVVQPRDAERARGLLARWGLAERIELAELDDGRRPRGGLIRSARVWGLESWRGTPLGTTWFDEFVEPLNAARVLDRYQADGVLCLAGHQPVVDPALCSAMLAHAREHAGEVDYVFTQAPPGLAGVIVTRSGAQELLRLNIPLGLFLAYRPEMVRTDPIIWPPCCQIAPEIVATRARFVADTRRSRERLSAALAELGDECDGAALCAWSQAAARTAADPLPQEIELELTTADPLPDTTLRPRGGRVPARQLEDLDAIARLASELASFDDTAVVLGGHGDPLLHPHFAEVCRRLRSAGIAGLGVVTPLVELPDDAFAALFDARVDLVEVLVDAHGRETYARVHGRDAFDAVRSNIDRIERERARRGSPQPLLAPSLTRCAETLGEMEPFFDDWIRQVGTAIVRGYNAYNGALRPDSLLSATPPIRRPCVRLGSRLTLLANGVVAQCSQDIGAAHPLGDWRTMRLEQSWLGTPLRILRAVHEAGRQAEHGLCESCSEWHRP